MDHIIFDTAPTGHTLRLLSLPRAWSEFLAGKDRGASCLGPHSGLKMQEARFNAALAVLGDPATTTVVLVTRPDPRPMQEAARAAEELRALGVTNQRMVINGVFTASRTDDPVASAIEALGRDAVAHMPDTLARLPRDEVPLRPFDTVGLPALRALLGRGTLPAPAIDAGFSAPTASAEPLERLADELAAMGHGLIMVMGKGGVGKTTIAAALAVGLVQRGHSVHLTTTDPAAHVTATLSGSLDGLKVGRIDPRVETQLYIDRIMATRGKRLDEQGRALLLDFLDPVNVGVLSGRPSRSPITWNTRVNSRCRARSLDGEPSHGRNMSSNPNVGTTSQHRRTECGPDAGFFAAGERRTTARPGARV